MLLPATLSNLRLAAQEGRALATRHERKRVKVIAILRNGARPPIEIAEFDSPKAHARAAVEIEKAYNGMLAEVQ